jgi:hypothetical protein
MKRFMILLLFVLVSLSCVMPHVIMPEVSDDIALRYEQACTTQVWKDAMVRAGSVIHPLMPRKYSMRSVIRFILEYEQREFYLTAQLAPDLPDGDLVLVAEECMYAGILGWNVDSIRTTYVEMVRRYYGRERL